MENDTAMILVAKLSYTHVENLINKTSIWSQRDIILIYLCWVSFILKVLKFQT